MFANDSNTLSLTVASQALWRAKVDFSEIGFASVYRLAAITAFYNTARLTLGSTRLGSVLGSTSAGTVVALVFLDEITTLIELLATMVAYYQPTIPLVGIKATMSSVVTRFTTKQVPCVWIIVSLKGLATMLADKGLLGHVKDYTTGAVFCQGELFSQ